MKEQNKEDDFNRDDSNRNEEGGFSRFAKDKRVRTRIKRVEKAPIQKKEDSGERRSFNPNFTKDNKRRDGQDSRSRDKSYGDEPNFNSVDYDSQQRKFISRDSGNSSRSNYKGRSDNDSRGQFNKDRQFGGDRKFGNDRNGDRKFSSDRKPSGERKFDPDRKFSGERKFDPDRKFGGDRKFNSDRRPAGDRKFDPDRKFGGDRKFGSDNKFKKDSRRPAYKNDEYPKFPQPKFDSPIRLNRYLAMAGVSSRREADELIKSGAVTVNGEVVTELGSKVEPTDIVQFEGNVVRSEKMIYIVMNKPKGYVTTLDDPHADKTVMDLLKNACKERIYPVGRLDKNSLGVLLVTNDGELTKHLTHPTYSKKKIYHVTLDRPVTKADMEQIVEGITLEDGEIHADEVNYVGESRKEVGIEIHSGRNRIIRRIFDYLGYRVVKLDRVYFGGMTKKNLKRGAWRFLTAREVDMLKTGMYE